MMKVIKIFATIAIIICLFIMGRLSLQIEDYATSRSSFPMPADESSKKCVQNLKKLNADLIYYHQRFTKLITLGLIYDTTTKYDTDTKIGENGLYYEENLSNNTYCPEAYGKLDNMQKKGFALYKKISTIYNYYVLDGNTAWDLMVKNDLSKKWDELSARSSIEKDAYLDWLNQADLIETDYSSELNKIP